MASAHGSLPNLLPPTYKRLISTWLEEDCPSFDYGGFVVGSRPATAHLYQKSPGKLAGVPFFDEVFAQLSCRVDWLVREGKDVYSDDNNENDNITTTTTTNTTTSSGIKPNDIDSATPSATHQPSISPPKRIHIATVTGPACSLLLGERVALNILARCTGIATRTSRLLSLIRRHEHHGGNGNDPDPDVDPIILAGTRKTTPGFRIPEKYAMLVGGADTHRIDLSTMTMLKDNHVAACGGTISGAVAAARAAGGFSVKIEVECGSEGEAVAAVEAGADVVMLDNFAAGEVAVVARRLKERFGGRSRRRRGQGREGGPKEEEEEGEKVEEAKVEKRRGEEGEGRRGSSRRRDNNNKNKPFLIEVSGGLTEETLLLEEQEEREGQAGASGYLTEDVDVVSTSSIHQGVPHVDFSLKIVGDGAATNRGD